MSDFCYLIEARQTLRTAKYFEHERLGAYHVDEIVLPMLQVKQKDVQQCSHENIEKNVGFSCKNWKNVAMIHGDGSWGWTMKSMQNEKVAKTSGENKNFEGRMFAKSEIVKKQW